MGIASGFICGLSGVQRGVSLRLVLSAAVGCALLLIPAARAAAFGDVEVIKAGPGAATSTVTSEPAGINCGTECSHEFESLGVTVQLTATPGPGYVLAGWSDAECADGPLSNPCEVTTGFFTTVVAEVSFVIAPPRPRASTGESSEVASHSADLAGSVDPEGSEVSGCDFEYGRSTEYGLTTPCTPANPGSGISAVTVTASLAGLAAETTYHYRLVASTLGGTVKGEDHSFKTEPAPPAISTIAPEYTQTLAHLRDLVNPERSPTTYFFRFGTTTSYGQNIPVPNASAGSGEAPVSISQMVTGLTPGVIYHYRLVATNASGSTSGPDQTFTALTPLPDNRAYEQVTPVFKSFDNFTLAEKDLAEASVEAIARDGTSVVVGSVPILGQAGADEEISGTYYGIERGSASWDTSSLTAPASVFPISIEEFESPLDAAVGLWVAATPSQSIHAANFYRREADGSFVSIGPIAPLSQTEGVPRGADTRLAFSPTGEGIFGASADLSRVVFNLNSAQNEGELTHLWPGDGTTIGDRPSLYEYVGSDHSGEHGDVPTLVGVDNTGAQVSECGTGLGGDLSQEPRREREAMRNGISRGGSTVFFTAQSGGCVSEATGPVSDQLYARVGALGGAQATVNVAGTSGCTASVSCDVTSTVTFQGASSDGRKVFFTTEQQLLPNDVDTTSDLYECELPGDAGVPPMAKGDVLGCPNLKSITATGTSSGAEVQSVVAVSEDGSRVYFTAHGVLTGTEENHNHEKAAEGEDNLYVWLAPGEGQPAGHAAFIGVLPENKPSEAQATPDGRYLVFTTTADLASDDISTAMQAFRYDAETGELVRVSSGQRGFNDDGNTTTDPVTLANAGLGRLTISDDGSDVVFQSDDALTPDVRSGKHNVYEWHAGEVDLISDGTDAAPRAGLIGIDATGEDIFFLTTDKLVGQDTDEGDDLYDARTNGGFSEPPPEAHCADEACQGPLAATLGPPVITSSSPPAVGNLIPPPKASPPPTKSITRVQQLAKVLRSCQRDRPSARRQSCERAARRRYGAVKKVKKVKKRKKRKGSGKEEAKR